MATSAQETLIETTDFDEAQQQLMTLLHSQQVQQAYSNENSTAQQKMIIKDDLGLKLVEKNELLLENVDFIDLDPVSQSTLN